MSAEEDDFFGIKSLNAMPLPQGFHQNVRAMPRHRSSAEGDQDLFEENFFPELSDKREKKTTEEDNWDSESSIIEEQFFPRRVPKETMSDLDYPPAEVDSIDSADAFEIGVDTEQTNGLKQLWALIDPIWKFGKDELVQYMAKRVIYETDDIIALDKPFQMSFSSGPDGQPQLDRILQELKQRIAPGIDRLYIVSSLDKNCSGVIVFAKSRQKQLELKSLLDINAFLFRYRCICKGIPKVYKARISIPLIKVMRGSNLKLCPLIGRADERKKLYHLNTDIKMVNECGKVQCSLLDAFERKGMSQLVRSHLYYGLNCPIVGDKKYVKAHLPKPEPVLETAISPNAMSALSLRKNDIRKMPMFLHRAEVHVPTGTPKNSGDGGGGAHPFHIVRAEVPPFFAYALKKLHLLKKWK